MEMSPSGEMPNSDGRGDIWLKGADGERQSIRVDSRVTGGAYSVIESVAEPGCAVPTHLHRNEDEHFLVISDRYRIAIGDRILDATPGTRATVLRNTAHSWRNVDPGKAGCWQSSPREASNKSPMRLGTFRLVQMPGSHEAIFTNPICLADKIIEAGRD
jgi:mannose-6-phosphate isomerase-like protein (cupin superfamily)